MTEIEMTNSPTPRECPLCGAPMIPCVSSNPTWVHEPGTSCILWAHTIRSAADVAAWNRRVPPPSDADAVASAARAVIAARFSTYKARNGREVGIEDASGEKCWIVPSDEMHALEQALLAPSVPPPGQAALVEALREARERERAWLAAFDRIPDLADARGDISLTKADRQFHEPARLTRAALSALPDGRAAARVE